MRSEHCPGCQCWSRGRGSGAASWASGQERWGEESSCIRLRSLQGGEAGPPHSAERVKGRPWARAEQATAADCPSLPVPTTQFNKQRSCLVLEYVNLATLCLALLYPLLLAVETSLHVPDRLTLLYNLTILI